MKRESRFVRIFAALTLALSLLLPLFLSSCSPDLSPLEREIWEELREELREEIKERLFDEEQIPSGVLPRPDISLFGIPEFSGEGVVTVNDNIPLFDTLSLSTESYEYYGELDSLGRCTYAVACIGRDLMPTEKREDIHGVKPSGWHSVRYDSVESGSLYNRSHLIGYQLSGENANEKNLITGTRYFNATLMLPFENMVTDYIKETDNHVVYRVTPCFYEDELVARGVLMEAYSAEDDGDGICFCVFVHNIQPGIFIDYSSGESYSLN